VLPRPNAIDTWLSSSPVKFSMTRRGPTNVHLGDLPSDQVECTVQLHAAEESFLGCSGIVIRTKGCALFVFTDALQ
jgi:hypothetical protein